VSNNPGPRIVDRVGWIVLGLLVLGQVIGGVSIISGRFPNRTHPVAGTATGPTVVGGGGAVPRSSPSQPSRPSPPRPPSRPTERTVSVSGVGNERTIACDDTIVNVSGVDNRVVLTGPCARVVVSGVKNVVTLERTGFIDISGMNNRIVFRSGTPEINQSGIDNTVERG
jgi:hypothetical protein